MGLSAWLGTRSHLHPSLVTPHSISLGVGLSPGPRSLVLSPGHKGRCQCSKDIGGVLLNPIDLQVEGREPRAGKGSPTQQDGARGGTLRWSCQFSVWGSLHGIKSLFPVEPLLSQADGRASNRPVSPMRLRLSDYVAT